MASWNYQLVIRCYARRRAKQLCWVRADRPMTESCKHAFSILCIYPQKQLMCGIEHSRKLGRYCGSIMRTTGGS